MKIDNTFRTADPDEMRRQLEGHESLLIPEVARLHERYASMTCPECDSPCRPVINTDRPFKPGQVTPNVLLHCNHCKAIFEPETKIIIRFGEAYDPLPTPADLFVNEPWDPLGS